MILRRVPVGISSRITMGRNLRSQISSTVETCASFAGGIGALRNAVNWFEGDTIAMQAIDEFLACSGYGGMLDESKSTQAQLHIVHVNTRGPDELDILLRNRSPEPIVIHSIVASIIAMGEFFYTPVCRTPMFPSAIYRLAVDHTNRPSAELAVSHLVSSYGADRFVIALDTSCPSVVQVFIHYNEFERACFWVSAVFGERIVSKDPQTFDIKEPPDGLNILELVNDPYGRHKEEGPHTSIWYRYTPRNDDHA